MRKFTIVVLILLAAYGVSAAVGMVSLVSAIERGDGAAILARTDLPQLRRSIVAQVLDVYLDGGGAQPSARSRLVAQTVGASVADLMLEKLMTPENITNLLRSGRMEQTEQVPGLQAKFARISSSDIAGMIGRFRPVGIRKFAIRLSSATDGDDYAELLLEFQPPNWQIKGIELPKGALRDLVARLPAK